MFHNANHILELWWLPIAWYAYKMLRFCTLGVKHSLFPWPSLLLSPTLQHAFLRFHWLGASFFDVYFPAGSNLLFSHYRNTVLKSRKMLKTCYVHFHSMLFVLLRKCMQCTHLLIGACIQCTMAYVCWISVLHSTYYVCPIHMLLKKTFNAPIDWTMWNNSVYLMVFFSPVFSVIHLPICFFCTRW